MHLSEHVTLGSILRWRALHQAEQVAFTHLLDGETREAGISFAGLDAAARAVAASLQARGLGRERAVLLLPTGLGFLKAFMGCEYAGTVAIPVPAQFEDPKRLQRTLPRLRAIVSDAGAKVLICAGDVMRQKPAILALAPELAALDWLNLDEIPDDDGAEWRETDQAGSELVFLQYSSGSTGRPKGVMVSHANLIHNSEAIRRAFGHDTSSRGVSWLPAYHDMGLVADMLQPIYAGFQMAFMSPFDFIRRPLRWLEAVSRFRATTSGAPNFAYALCAARIDAEAAAALDLSQWQVAYDCAEPVSASVIEAFCRALAPAGFRREAFFPFLGMAEASLMVSAGTRTAGPVLLPVSRQGLLDGALRDPGPDELPRLLVGNGKSLPDQVIRIVDPERGQALPEGRVGEIWVSGPSVAQGYWQQPAASQESFAARLADDPRAYLRTGDLGALREGELFITGRLKDLMIVQGQNHYPQDLEASAEAAHDALRPGCSAVFALEREPDSAEALVLVAEVLASETHRSTSELAAISYQLRGEILATHQLPLSRVVLVAPGTISKTSSGKIQRKACREALHEGTLDILFDSAEGGSEALHTDSPADIETALIGVMADLLGIDTLAAEQDFFALGGHSLLATQLAARIREHFGVELPLGQIFATPTPAALAAWIARGGGRALPELKHLDQEGPLPLSYAQERLWFSEQIALGTGLYNLPLTYHLRGELDITALEQSFRALLARHPALRTRFVEHQGQPAQIIEPADGIAFGLQILQAEPFDAEDQPHLDQALHRIGTEALHPFDLGRAPLIRALLLQIAPDAWLLTIALHHLIADGWSLGLLQRELADYYAAALDGAEPVTEPSRFDAGDYACWQREWLKGEVWDRQLSYWRAQLDGTPGLLNLPSDRPRPARASYRGARIQTRLDAGLRAVLEALARREQVTPFMALLAVFQVLLARYSGESDLCVGVPVANRRLAALEPQVGFFVNTLVLRADLGADPDFLTFLAQVRSRCLEAFAHQDFPFEKLVEALNPERSLSHHPLFQVMFVLQDEAYGRLNLPGLEASLTGLAEPAAKFDLSLELIPEAGGYLLGIEYAVDLFEPDSIRRFAVHFETLLKAVLADPGAPLSELDLLSDSERELLLETWNPPAISRPRAADGQPALLQAGFEAQAAKTPEAIAIMTDDERLSYRELDELAKGLARKMHKHGLGPGMLVGLCLGRRPSSLAALLAILKLGAAYVPIDPAYPPERIAYLLADARADGLISSAAFLAGREDLPANSLAIEDLLAALAAEPPSADSSEGPGWSALADPDPLSHVIYTSGSTGRPKGVMIRHAAAVALCEWALGVFEPEELRGVLASTSLCFDLSIFEIFVPLSCGGTVMLLEDVLALPRFAAREQVSLINTVPSAVEPLLALGAIPASVSTINLAGEPLKNSLVRQLYAKTQVRRVFDLYGPSEDTTYSTYQLRSPEEIPSIGRPIAGTQAYIVDARLQPVPVGLPGELLLGGAGLARGYLHQPALTAERFIPNPFGPGRLYRTGDRCRFLPDGRIQYLGRLDHQLKLRGFRIEPGEIEACLEAHPAVAEAVVICRDEASGPSLSAYLVPAREARPETDAADALATERVAQWQALYQETYREADAEVPGEDFSGWVSAISGTAIPIHEMRRWRDATLARILSLKPERIYEIGCGTGLLVAGLAPRVEAYLASDFSQAAVARVEALKQAQGLRNLQTLARSADDFSGIEAGRFDTILLNSVVQYFPSADYLLEVLKQAAARLSPGGRIFLGDIRDLALLKPFQALIKLASAPAGQRLAAVRAAVDQAVRREEELCLAPEFFQSLPGLLPGLSRVETLIKRGLDQNELHRYRYDVILHFIQESDALVGEQLDSDGSERLDWQPGFNPDSLGSLAWPLIDSGKSVRIAGIPNPRLQQAFQAADLLKNPGPHLRIADIEAELALLRAEPQTALEAYWRLAESLNCNVSLSPGGIARSDCFELMLWPEMQAKPAAARAESGPSGNISRAALATFSNQPLQSRREAALLPGIRDWLEARLPAHLQPSHLILLERLPLTPNGKLDRKALPAPHAGRSQSEAAAAPPRNPRERVLCALFCDLLALEAVGIHESFFALGGHSLLATQLAARLREHFGIALPLRQVFESPSVAELAACLAQNESPDDAWPPLQAEPENSRQPAPLTSAQARLWFLEQLEPGSPLYHIPIAWQLAGEINPQALAAAFRTLIARHDMLRTRFASNQGTPSQSLSDDWHFELALHRIDDVDQISAERAAISLAEAETARPFDLSRPPLLRAMLISLGQDRHLLVLTLHHLISDGWSLGLLLEELRGAYADALVLGSPEHAASRTPSHAEPAYADYARWQQGLLASGAYDAQLAYWRRQLAAAPELLQLPTDRPRPGRESHRGRRIGFGLGPALSRQVLSFAAAAGVTPFMLLLAGFKLLLARYSRQNDLCVGVPVANRRLAALEALQGLFVNTVVIRSDLESDPGFNQLLAGLKTRCLEAFAHQDLPFDKLVEALNPARSLSHHPIFQVMFAYRESGSSLSLPGIRAEETVLETGVAKFDLNLDMLLSEGELVGRLEYASDLFDEATIERMAHHYRQLLASAIAAPELPASRLELLSSQERKQVLLDWNQTRVEYPPELCNRCIHQLIEAQVRRTPDVIAAISPQGSLSYAGLNAAANRLAHHLRAQGVGPDVLVGLSLERSLELLIGMLAILKAGGAYVPLDPEYPRERLAFMLADTGTRLVLAHDASLRAMAQAAAGLHEDRPQIINLDDSAAWVDEPDTDPESGVGLGNLISVIYTSGSTGKPKGVLNLHRGVSNHLIYRQSLFNMNPSDRVMQKTSVNFDGSVWELFWPLMAGARLIFAKPSGQRDTRYLCEFIQAHGITKIDFVPAMLQEFLNDPLSAGCRSLRRLYVGGEGLSYPLQQEAFARLGIPITHGYGPTETTISVIYWECLREGPLRTVPIGRPLGNITLYVLDAHRQPVPIGVAGELYIGGDGLARGYLNRPELTAERFVPNPFGPGRLYRSGDLVRYLADGNVEFVGRVDQQVKIRGFRIEPGEIEAMLCRHPDVREALVLAREDRPGDKRLVAYLVCPQSLPAREELRLHLRSELPEYMVPAAYVALERLPLDPNGKLDRRALPAPDPIASESDYSAPETEHEALLCALFAELLGLARVGRHDGFFDLGGHSLLATRLVARIRERQGLELPLRSLFETPTPAALAKALSPGPDVSAGPLLPPIQPLARPQFPAGFALSYAQERLWFMDQLQPGSALYNIPMALRLKGPLDERALETAFRGLIQRHESLRTHFVMRDGQPLQMIEATCDFSLARLDYSQRPDAEAAARERALADAVLPFDLSEAPLLRTALIRLGLEDHLLILNLHHIISDGWSWKVMMNELSLRYAAARRGLSPELAPLAVQYADYAQWQKLWFQGEVFQTQLAYWRARLADAPALLNLPADRPRPAIETYRGARVEHALGAELTARLDQLARAEGVTLFMLLLAAFQVLLSRLSGAQDLCVGVPVANRRLAALEPQIGFFVNTLVLRAELGEDPAFAGFLAQVRERCLEAYAHQDLPFEKLVEELNPERSLSHHPLFQVLFVLQEQDPAGFRFEGLEASAEDPGSRESRFDLALELIPRAGGLSARFEYSRELFDPETIARFAACYQALLAAILAQPQTPVSRLPLQDAVARAHLLALAQGPVAALPALGGVHDLIAAHAAACPEAIALACAERQMSYAELDRAANRLAWKLRRAGAGPETLVGLCIGRSLEAVVAILAVFKAGAAYLPLDPDYPRERLAWLLEDARPALILAEPGLSARLPETGIPSLPLLHEAEDADQDSAAAPPVDADASRLAYVIYTSGSTGLPKGALLTQRGLLNLARAQQIAYPIAAGEHVLLFASWSFDASIFDLVLALCNGNRLCLAPKAELMPGPELQALIRRQGITTLCLPPSALAALPLPTEPGSLRRLSVAGEACPPGLAAAWARICQVYNAYGPTEATVWSSLEPFTSGPSFPIGRPIANSCLYVLDAQAEPVPIGVTGELYIGGPGLARGYLNRPELTQERFVPNPFGPDRLYRTGDAVRMLPDGRLEYLGRLDQQLKLRGFRIESAEIETALLAHPDVQEALVLAREWGLSDDSVQDRRRLVAYLVPAQASLARLEAAQVSHWHSLYQESHRDAIDLDDEDSGSEPGSDFRGWNSSFDGAAIPLDQMQEWRDATVARILALKPRRVYEIGCGTGLLLSRVAPHCESYLASDFAPTVITRTESLRRKLPGLDSLRTAIRVADDFSGLAPASFDTIVINSVIQYFPSANYLYRVLTQAMACLSDGGRLLVGDVRHLGLLPAFQAAVAMARAQDATSLRELRQHQRRSLEQEEELCLDPGFFTGLIGLLPGLGRVEILHKRGQGRNELNDYRYDVILHKGPIGPETVEWSQWRDASDLHALRESYAQSPRTLGLRGIPDGRLESALAAAGIFADEASWPSHMTLVDIRLRLAAFGSQGCDSEALWNLQLPEGTELSVRIDRPGCLAVVLSPAAKTERLPESGPDSGIGTLALPGKLSHRANQPLLGRLRAALIPEIRQTLSARLPEHLLPADYVLLAQMPLTPNGKIDRKALPAPGGGREAAGKAYAAPDTESERLLCGLFAEVLGSERVGRHDSFFDLGGHSLLATQLAARIRDSLRIEMPLKQIFATPTVAGLAASLAEKPQTATSPACEPIQPAPPGTPLKLSHSQEMWWTLFPRREELEHGIQNSYAVLKLEGSVDAGALEAALGDIIARHESLRTTFTGFGRKPRRVVHQRIAFSLTLKERFMPEADALTALQTAAETSFDLERGPLIRSTLHRLGPTQSLWMFSISHLVFDGWSLKILLRELDAAYAARLKGMAPDLPPLPIQYSDYVHWHRGWIKRQVLGKQMLYWLRQGRKMPVILDIPTDRPRPKALNMGGGGVSFSLAQGLIAQLNALGRQEGATLYMLLLAGFQVLLHQYAGHADIFVGTPVANRPRQEVEAMIGLFLNFLVLRASLSGNPSFREFLAQVRETCLDAFANQDLPFQLLLKSFKAYRTLTTLRSFQTETTMRSNVMFNLLDDFSDKFSLGPLQARLLPLRTAYASQTLHLIMTRTESGVSGQLIYSRDLFDESTIVALTLRYQALLAQFCRDPQAGVSQTPA